MSNSPDPAALLAERIVQDVAELPDRTSPDDWPEAMLVTSEELRAIVVRALAAPQETPQGWQPIEMADKYGPPIHVYSDEFVDPDFNPSGCREACRP